jgi:hypothetical protein
MIARVTLFGGPDDGAVYEVSSEYDSLPAAIRVPHSQQVEVSRGGLVLLEERPVGVAVYLLSGGRVGALPDMTYGWGGWEAD